MCQCLSKLFHAHDELSNHFHPPPNNRFESPSPHKLLCFHRLHFFLLWVSPFFAQIEAKIKLKCCAHFSNEDVKSNLQEEQKQKNINSKQSFISKRPKIIYSRSASIVDSIRFIVLPISKKFRHKSRRRSYLEFIRIAFRYAQIFFRYEPVSFLFRFMWVFLRKQWVVTLSVTHHVLKPFEFYSFSFFGFHYSRAFQLNWFYGFVLVSEDTLPTNKTVVTQARSQQTFRLFSFLATSRNENLDAAKLRALKIENRLWPSFCGWLD